MKNSFSFFKVILVLLPFTPFFTFSQVQDEGQNIYTLFDDTVGLDNTALYNGLEYREKYRSGNNSYSYFNSPNFLIGSINYGGETYFNLNIKYDLYEQEVIVKIKNRNSTDVTIKLFKDKINSFTIDNRFFVKIAGLDSGLHNINGFYQIGFSDSNYTLLIKHKKIKKDLYHEERMYVEYVTAKKEYLILSNNSYNELDSKKDIIKLFPDLKQKINKFYRDNKSLRKTNYDQFLMKLLQELSLAKLK